MGPSGRELGLGDMSLDRILESKLFHFSLCYNSCSHHDFCFGRQWDQQLWTDTSETMRQLTFLGHFINVRNLANTLCLCFLSPFIIFLCFPFIKRLFSLNSFYQMWSWVTFNWFMFAYFFILNLF